VNTFSGRARFVRQRADGPSAFGEAYPALATIAVCDRLPAAVTSPTRRPTSAPWASPNHPITAAGCRPEYLLSIRIGNGAVEHSPSLLDPPACAARDQHGPARGRFVCALSIGSQRAPSMMVLA